jgi:hypothetical protein
VFLLQSNVRHRDIIGEKLFKEKPNMLKHEQFTRLVSQHIDMVFRAALVAALSAMLAITVSASERVQNWDVLLSGIEMDHLTVSFTFANGEGMPDLILKLEDELVYPHVIMKDGSRIRLIPYGSDGSSTRNLLAEAPLVYEEIDHILMADGTVIPMPKMSK